MHEATHLQRCVAVDWVRAHRGVGLTMALVLASSLAACAITPKHCLHWGTRLPEGVPDGEGSVRVPAWRGEEMIEVPRSWLVDGVDASDSREEEYLETYRGVCGDVPPPAWLANRFAYRLAQERRALVGTKEKLGLAETRASGLRADLAGARQRAEALAQEKVRVETERAGLTSRVQHLEAEVARHEAAAAAKAVAPVPPAAVAGKRFPKGSFELLLEKTAALPASGTFLQNYFRRCEQHRAPGAGFNEFRHRRCKRRRTEFRKEARSQTFCAMFVGVLRPYDFKRKTFKVVLTGTLGDSGTDAGGAADAERHCEDGAAHCGRLNADLPPTSEVAITEGRPRKLLQSGPPLVFAARKRVITLRVPDPAEAEALRTSEAVVVQTVFRVAGTWTYRHQTGWDRAAHNLGVRVGRAWARLGGVSRRRALKRIRALKRGTEYQGVRARVVAFRLIGDGGVLSTSPRRIKSTQPPNYLFEKCLRVPPDEDSQ